jgi:hypothetical protein
MAARKHDYLSPKLSRWLIALADPLARCPLPQQPLTKQDLSKLLLAAPIQGVLPAVRRNLQNYAKSSGFGSMPSEREIAALLNALSPEADLLKQAALERRLTEYSRKIADSFAKANIGFAMVKGDRFARLLYPNAEDRPFGDLDILIPVEDLEKSREVMPPLGFKLKMSRASGGDANMMDKWILAAEESITVETQTNLVHAPKIAKKIGLSYEQLLIAGRGNPEDATALLAAAAIHAAVIHQMDRLQHVIDVLQAVRGVAGPVDAESLKAAAHATGSTVAIQTALDTAFQMFDEQETRALADQLQPCPWRGLRQKLVTPSVVINTRSRRSRRDRWRRRLARLIMTRAGQIARLRVG